MDSVRQKQVVPGRSVDDTTTAIVMPTHNRARLLGRALACLGAAKERVPGKVEIIVADDGSTDNTAAILASALSDGRVDQVVTHRRPRGPAATRNRGWRASRAHLIAFTDDDCEVAPDWLHRLVRALEDASPHIAGVGGRVKAARTGLIADYMTYHRILEPPVNVSYLVTANALFRRDALEAVGGFDEAVTAPGGEDPGLCLNLRELGYRFTYEESAVVYHHYRQSLRSYLKTFYRYGRGCHIVMDP